jgi:hypothetical protein
MTGSGVTAGEAIEIRTRDGLTIRAERWDAGERCAVLVHDRGDDLDSVRPITDGLINAGFTVVAIDRIGHGASDDRDRDDAAADQRADLCDVIGSLSREQGVYLVGVGEAALGCLSAAVSIEPSLVALVSPTGTDTLAADVLAGDPSPTMILFGAHNRDIDAAVRRLGDRRPGTGLLVQLPTVEQAAALIRGPYGHQVVNHIVGYSRQIEPRTRS